MSELLLEWMSFRNTGELKGVPSALLGGARVQRAVEDLSMLGHVEAVDERRWRIAPPVLAGAPHDARGPWTAVLCGARTAGVMARLADACANTGAALTSAAVVNRPAVVTISAATRQCLAETAHRSGIPLQRDAAFTLLACLPTLSEWPRLSCPMIAGRVDVVRRFSRSKLEWVESSLAEATAAPRGVFRLKRDWDWVTVFKSSASDCARIDDRAGRLIVASGRRVLVWDSKSGTLSFPLRLYPPGLIARALSLCTGALPLYKDRYVSFGGITPAVLRVTLAITELKVV